MEQTKDTAKSREWQQLTEPERYKIEAWLQSKISAKDMAQMLGKSVKTIKREIALGTVQQDNGYKYIKVYKADYAQKIRNERASAKGRGLAIGRDREQCREIERLIGEQRYSPDAAVMELRRLGQRTVCTKTVYNMVYSGLFLSITNESLPTKPTGKKRDYRKIRKVALNNRSGKSITERPREANERAEYGHWEIDLVVGKQGTKPVILTLVERLSRKSLYVLVKNKTQDEIIAALKRLQKRIGDDFSTVFKTITSDNGSEFLDHEGIKSAAKCAEVYYAHPYSSWERGSNENGNRILRRFIPKGTDIGTISESELQQIEDWVNNYPRRIFGGKSANQMAA